MTYLFDLSGVVVTGGEPNAGPFHALSFSKAFGVTPENLAQAWFAPWAKFKLGQVGEDAFWQEYLTLAGASGPNLQTAKALYRELCLEIPGVKQVIKGLRAAGHQVGALTNNSKEWLDFQCGQFNLHYYFSPIIASCQVGLAKPSREFFEHALKELAMTPKEVVFIDNQANNIRAAEELGIKSVLFEGADELAGELGKIKNSHVV